MKKVLKVLRFTVAVVCVLALVTVVVFAQSEREKAWDDAVELFNQAVAACDKALFQDAIYLYEEALVIMRALEQQPAEGIILYSLGLCYESCFDYKRAINYYEQSLVIYREINNREGEADSLNSLAMCFYYLCEYQRAINYFEQVWAIDRENDNPAYEALHFFNLGVCYRSLSDYQRAASYYEQSLVIYREINDNSGEARCLNGLGVCCKSLSEYQRAISYYEQSLVIKRDIGDHAGEADTLSNLGNCYYSLSDYQRAISDYEQAQVIYRKINDQFGTATILHNIAGYYYSLSEYQRAISYYEQSLVIKRDIDDRAGEADSLNGLGNCYSSLSDYQRAIGYYEQSLAICLEIGDRAGAAASLSNLGLCYYFVSEYQQAIAYHEQALSLSMELGTRGTERLAHWGLGRTYRAMEQPEMALSHYEAAIEIVESIRGTVEDEDLRQSYFGSVRTLYEEYLELLLELGRNDETVLVAERLRARTFLDGLYQAGLAPEQMLHAEQGIVVTGDLETAVMDPEAIAKAVAEAQGSLLPNEAALEYMVTDDGIYLWILTSAGTLGPEFIPYNREQLLRDVVELRRAIEPHTEVVDGQPEISFSDPSELLGHFYELLIQPVLSQLTGGVNTLIIIPSGPLWYVPFSALVMTDCSQVEFWPSGSGGTKQYRPRYLIDNYTLAFLPSLASLPMLMEERAPSTAIYLALANPTLSEKQQKEVGSHYQFSVLEAACLAFAECIAKGEEDVHVKEEALEARAYNEAAGHKVLVYACHGIFNPSVPLDSRLLLAPSQEEEQETTGRRLLDGNYYAYEVILTDHTGVDLVILAACETLLPTLREVQGALGMTLGAESDEKLNMGQLELIVAGDEVVGLSRAFLSSGARSVLGTLWQANPTAINELLVAICNAYPEEGGSWAVALKEAQCAILQESNSTFILTYQTGLSGAHPWFWGAYQLIGRWR
jgi:tetratricopeptide (TPR) repeat protein/CHAT domain-containing protein